MQTIPDWDHDALTSMITAQGENVVERLDHWARTTPDKTFFYYGERDETFSYAHFGALTDAIAGSLHNYGIVRGDRVSVLSTNSLLCALVMFASWKVGAVYAPINFSFTGRMLTYQINDTRARLLITDAALLGAVNDVAGDLDHLPEVVLFEPSAGDGEVASTRIDPVFATVPWAELTIPHQRPVVDLEFDDPASIFYTSGTTGPAKGVVQPHRWLAGYTYFPRLLLSSDDVIYNDLPLYHVGGAIANVARAVWVGCEVAVWDRFSPSEFWTRVASRDVSAAVLLDVMIPWLLKAPSKGDDRMNTLNKVHMQPLPLHHQEFASRFGIDVVTAAFGQTESGACLGLVIEETEPGEGTPLELYRGLSRTEILARAREARIVSLRGGAVTRKGTMGMPTPFMEVAVLDERDRPCGVGEAGELAVRPRLPGVLFSEYLGKPEATVSAWRNLWFHTGDAAVLQPDGMFDFVDRLGDRIRVRGENLSSFQVEDLLNQHPGVQMSAVVAITSSEGDEDDICAFVVPLDDAQLSAEELHNFAVASMPKFMRPRHIRVVAEIPRTPTNKVEKYKLRSMILAESTVGAD